MAREDFDDARYRQDAEREEYEREGAAGGRQTDYERRRRLREKDDWYSILDDEPEAHP
ncbi:MAG: hypothetical protein IJ692_06830 [Alloprevotella sp.]|nr:hypothetical protein [Alloprevotella sp.]MBR1595051.1 hypothetical protein [Alloprevotella sp.]MBR1652591.1 hypothetical protein [Alloprevotella sp.]MBR1653086.1 hypothetical protein [Alloprevotella sp.]